MCGMNPPGRGGIAFNPSPEFVALHRAITERNARILYRGTDVAGYNEPKALAQRG
jgi:hypothetical protein